MDTRETKKVTIGAYEVEIKTYLTGREKRELMSVFLGKNLSVSPDGANVAGLDAATVAEAQDLTFKTVIVSIDGHKEGDIIGEGENAKTFSIVDAVLDMHGDDFDAVVKAVNEINKATDFLEGSKG